MSDIIDLRSDTVTVPTESMRKAISEAKVGDDVFADDPTVNVLQEYIADLTGKEAALFVPSGTMSNQIAIGVNTKIGDEVIVETDSHIFQYEAGAPAIISGVQLRTIQSANGMMDIQTIENSIRPLDDHCPRTSLICLENTHNRHGGTIIPLDYIHNVEKIVKKHNLMFHCDGARLWNASAATGIEIKEYAKPFDTVSLCFSKGLGAPIGSILVSTKEKIFYARRRRKVMGGGMRQVGIIASAALYAVKNHFPLLKHDHEHARMFAKLIGESEFIKVNSQIDTNIVFFDLINKNPAEFEAECKKQGLLLIALGGASVRCVFHFQIDELMTRRAADIIKDVLNKMN